MLSSVVLESFFEENDLSLLVLGSAEVVGKYLTEVFRCKRMFSVTGQKLYSVRCSSSGGRNVLTNLSHNSTLENPAAKDPQCGQNPLQ